MVVVGARGHAMEVLDVLESTVYSESIYFYDNITPDMPAKLFGKFIILRTPEQIVKQFEVNPHFVLGIGGPRSRQKMAAQLTALGGRLVSALSTRAQIGKHAVELGQGLNVMHEVLISNDVIVGEGTLLNASSALHHGVRVGEYCEISPNARLLGNVKIADFVQIGAGAIILPHVQIGRNAIVGAGAVVTKNVADNVVVAGVPAKAIRFL